MQSHRPITRLNLTVLIADPDFYARHALNSYLAWDRRTRVVHLARTLEESFAFLQKSPPPELPDVLLMDAELRPDATSLGAAITHARQLAPKIKTICLGHTADPQRAASSLDAGACAYFVRDDVRHLVAGAVCYAVEHTFVVSHSLHAALTEHAYETRLYHAQVLPNEKPYPELTERIRQALSLCVVEGMSAQLAADEMGVSPHTVRSYIKEGYRILEAHDNHTYPDEMGPIERAFMRFTALDDEADV